MNGGHLLALLRQLRHRAGAREAAALSDRQLLERYALARDESAFAALLRRHGGMVWGVCRRVLADIADADDAFQATFLVLIHKAATLRNRESLATWLQGVAWRLSRRVKAEAARRRIKEGRVQRECVTDFTTEIERRDLRALLDEELDRLPEKYRAPLVLCYLEGLSYTEAARQLGWRDGTVCGRLARAREMLRQRLSRRGVTLSIAALTALAEPATAPAETMAVVAKMAALFALGQTIDGAVPVSVTTLAQGFAQAMTAAKLKTMAVLVVVLGLVAGGAGVATSYFLARKPPEIQTAADVKPDKPAAEKTERTDLYGDPLPPGALLRMGTVRFRNRERIGQIVFSPDGKIVAAGDDGGKILLYDAATGGKIRQLQTSTNHFVAMSFAPDGKTLASADYLGSIQIWNLAAGKEIRHFGIQTPWRSIEYRLMIVPLVFSHDGKSLAWAAPDHSIRIYDPKTGKELVKLSGHDKPIRCLAFSSDDKWLFSANDHERFLPSTGRDEHSLGASVRVWQVAESKEMRKISLHRPEAFSQPEPLCFSPDGKTLALAEQDFMNSGYVVAFLDLETGKEVRKRKPEPGRIKAAIFSPDGKTFAAMRAVPKIVGALRTIGTIRSLQNSRIQLWETATGKQLMDFPAYAENMFQSPCRLAFSPDGKKLAAASSVSSLHVWDVARGREEPDRPDTHHDFTSCVVFSPDGRTLASGSGDHSIALWDAACGKLRLRLRGHEGAVVSLAFSPDGKLLASVAFDPDYTVRLWDAATGKELRCYFVPWEDLGHGVGEGVTAVAFVDDGKILAASGTDGKIRLWDVATGKEVRNRRPPGLPMPLQTGRNHLSDSKGRIYDVAFTTDGRKLVFAELNTIHVADVSAVQRLFHFKKDFHPRGELALSPDGKTLAVGGGDRTLRLVEVASGQDLHMIELPKSQGFRTAAFSANGRTLAVASDRNQGWISLFDVATGKQRLRLHGAASQVRHLVFSPDGTKLASAQSDSTAMIWEVSAARRKLPGSELTVKDIERLWTDLRDMDAVRAYAALWTLVAAPDKAVPFLKQHLHPVPHVTPDRLQRLIVDLDSDEFARREEASRQLAKLGSEAKPALRKALESKPSLEMRRRTEALLKDLACQTEMTPDALRQIRAIQVLEQIGSPEARNILKSLTQGAPAAPATRDAGAALRRLDPHSYAP